MPPKRASRSPSPNADNEASTIPKVESTLPTATWSTMLRILTNIYDYRDADGHDPSKLFQRMVNKRHLPDYYDIIKEPIALSSIKTKINNKEYLTVKDFVRDFALIAHNAFVYNMPDSGAYQDALVIKQQIDKQLQQAVVEKSFTAEDVVIPYLGEIPSAEDNAIADDDDNDDEDDDDEEDGEEESGARRAGRVGPRKSSFTTRRDTIDKKDDETQDSRRKRRPPKVFTPLEGRIQVVLKGIRKLKNPDGSAMISHFERLPDKAALPDYFVEIRYPIAYDMLRRKHKRKKYTSMEQFSRDAYLMFDNAMQYNQDESEIYQNAVALKTEANRLISDVQSRPDGEFVSEEGRLPLPEGILYNGELYKIGDWILLQNVNDLTKPIPSQIYRTYQDTEGGKWINACWYYRPEQTVHRYDKHFYKNEVLKTGQYRDHRMEDIVGRCFIMFITRYFKGRPSNISRDTEVFVCDARYNEEKQTFNKIKTWASCLPDEVREKDYPMDSFSKPEKMRKYITPLAGFLRDEQHETDEMPRPEWGAENAPPKLGAVHRRPRDTRDSSPPEPSPSPPPPTIQRPNIQTYPSISGISTHQQSPMRSSINSANPKQNSASNTPIMSPHYPQQSQQTASPLYQARPPYQAHYSQNAASSTPSSTLTRPPLLQPVNTAYNTTTRPSPQQHSSQPNTNPNGIPPDPFSLIPDSIRPGPPPIEVYTLPEQANQSIPEEIRHLFQRDEQGRVLFFTAPPSANGANVTTDLYTKATMENKKVCNLGHSAKFIASKYKSAFSTEEVRGRNVESEEERLKRRAEYRLEKENEKRSEMKRKREEITSGYADDRRNVLTTLSDMMRLSSHDKKMVIEENNSTTGLLFDEVIIT